MDILGNKEKSNKKKFYREDQKLRKVRLCLGQGGATMIVSPSARGSGATIVTAAGTAATEAAGDQN